MCKYTLTNLDCGHSREHIQPCKRCNARKPLMELCEESDSNTAAAKAHGKCHKCDKKSTRGRGRKPADVPSITTKLANMQVSAPATSMTRKPPSSSQLPAQPTKPQPAAAGGLMKSGSLPSAQPTKPQAAAGGPTKVTGSMAPAKAPVKPTAGTSSSQMR